jgi:hypothetical protein
VSLVGFQSGMMALVAGPSLPALANSDDFSVNTIASYTETHDTGTPVWSVSGGAMHATGIAGMQSTLRRNTFSQADVAVECDILSADDDGLVLRFADQSNFYLMTLADDTSSLNAQNIRIFKRVAGTFTQLGSSVDLTWVRGVAKTFRFTATGSALNAYMGGVLQLSVTDATITAAGAIGMRANASSSAVDALRWG